MHWLGSRRDINFKGALAIILLSGLIPTISSAQLRLHSPSEEQLTSDLAAQLDKAHAAHLAALDDHRSYLETALARERQLLVQRELAERDAVLTAILSAKSRKEDPARLLDHEIAAEWSEIAGQSSLPREPRAFRNATERVANAELELDGLHRNLAAVIAIFERKNGKGQYCDADGAVDPSFSVMANLPEAQAIQDICAEIKTEAAKLGAAYTSAGSDAALLGDPNAPSSAQLGVATAEAKAVAELLAAQAAISKSIATQLKALNRYYQCQLNRSSVEQATRADAQAVQNAIDAIADGDAKTIFDAALFTGLWDTLRSGEVDPDCNKAAAPAAAPVAPTKGLSGADIAMLVGKLDRYAAGDALLSALQNTALDIQGSELGDALTGLAAEPDAMVDSKAGKQAQAALKIFGKLETLYRAKAGALPDTAGVLVALADVRMRQATANIEASRLAELDRLSKLRLTALRRRALWLADAAVALKPMDDVAVGKALQRYSASWNEGAIPATVLGNDMTKGRYLPWLDRERAIVDASYVLLAPAANQLQVYSKAGITPDTVAQFLQAVGLGSIAVAK